MAMQQQQQMQMLADLEVEMTTDMLKRMTAACQKKCVSTSYSDGELSKGEGVCLDRCVAKYLEINESMGKKLSEMFKQDEATMKQIQEQQAQGQR